MHDTHYSNARDHYGIETTSCDFGKKKREKEKKRKKEKKREKLSNIQEERNQVGSTLAIPYFLHHHHHLSLAACMTLEVVVT